MAGNAPPPHRTQIPNIVDDLGLDPYERALYVHYKRVCGENQGAYCYEATRTTAGKVKMSAAQVSVSRRVLAERGLIIVQAETRPVVVVVVNIWEINTAFYKLEHRPDVDGWSVEQVKIWLCDMSTDVHTMNVTSHNESDTRSYSEHSLTESDARSYSEHQAIDMSSDVHTVKQRIESSLIVSSPKKESEEESGKPPPSPIKVIPVIPDEVARRGQIQPKPDPPPPRLEYTPFLRKFLAYFNAKRFRNDTQAQTVSGLIERHGEAEIEELAGWAAKKGMGLGQAIPAIETASKHPKPTRNGANHYGKQQPTINRADLADPANFAAQLEAVSGKPRPPGG